jgi:hypothetical protein
MDIGTIVAKITADVSGFKGGMNQVQSSLKTTTTSMKGIVTAAAAVTVAVVAVSAVMFKLASDAAAAGEVSNYFWRTFGDGSESALNKLREASKGTISDIDLMATANRASLLGVSGSVDELSQLMVTARLRGKAMGLDTTTAFNDIVTGIGRGSPLILDNLGIKIPDSAKKLMESMTGAEKTTYLMNLVIADGAELAEKMGGDVLTASDKFQILKATISNAKQQLGQALIPIMEIFLNKIFHVIGSVTDWVKSMGGLSGIFQTVGNTIADNIGIIMGVLGALVGYLLLVVIPAFIATAAAAIKAALAAAAAWILANPLLAAGILVAGGIGIILAKITGLTDKIKSSVSSVTDKMKVEIPKQTNMVVKGTEKEASAHDKKTQQIKEDLDEENEAYAEACAKRKRSFEENMASLVKDHLAKKKALEDDIADENDDFNENMSDIKSNYADDMETLKSDHEDKVATIQEQIDAETAKGLDADATILASFQAELAEENAEYDAQVIKKDADYKKEVDKETQRHLDALLAYTEKLDAENAILEKHASEVAQFKDAIVLDDIERLKRSYEEENAEAQKQHEKKVADLYKQGYEETASYNAGKDQANAEATNKAISNASKEADKVVLDPNGFSYSNPKYDPNSPFYEKPSAPTITTNNAETLQQSLNNDDFNGINRDIGVIKSIGNWFKNLLGFDVGGVVPGQIGSRRMIIAHGGETILPTHKQGFSMGNNITISMAGANISSPGVAEAYAEMIGDTIMKKLSRSTRA